MFKPLPVEVSGERFTAVYHLRGSQQEAYEAAREICLEQTVELPDGLVPPGDIREHIVGRIEAFASVGDGIYRADISYAVELSGFELPQLLNVVFGNTAMKANIRVVRLDLPDVLLRAFKGPRFGREGLRDLLGAPHRALLGTALKPVGFPAHELARFAHDFALGGVDVIKDDHGLANQPIADFYERTRRCAEAVAEANLQSGGRSIYVPNVSGPVASIFDRAMFAKEAGVGGIEVAPGLVSYDVMRQLAEDDRLSLPVFSHPALLGAYLISPGHGFSYFALHGQIARLAGADAVIYTNYGGRFPTTPQDCRDLAAGTLTPMSHFKTSFPMPGGGMSLDRAPEMVEFYDRGVILLISGGLFEAGPDLIDNARRFRELVEKMG